MIQGGGWVNIQKSENPGKMHEAIVLHRRIEELREVGLERQLRLKEKLEISNLWDRLKQIVILSTEE